MNDLISKQALKEDLLKRGFYPVIVKCALEAAPIVDAVVLPCKIGDTAWAIRNFCGELIPKCGVVSEMYFSNRMELVVAVKNIGRGVWGNKIFPTYEDARNAIGGRK